MDNGTGIPKDEAQVQDMPAPVGKETRKKKKILAVLLILLLAIAGGFGIWQLTKAPAGAGGIIYFDESAQTGNLPGKSFEQIQRELDQIVEKGMFNISIAAEVFFDRGDSAGSVRIENIQANPYHMQVTVTLDSTGEVLYESGAIKPGQYIEKIGLAKELAKGRYPATATFTALDQKTLKPIGTAAAKIELVIES